MREPSLAEWELVYAVHTDDRTVVSMLERVRVPGGWLYVFSRNLRSSLFRRGFMNHSMAFVPDPAGPSN